MNRLQLDLRQAMRSRERTRVAVLRTALAAIANAEAVDAAPGADPRASIGAGPIAGASVGAGSTEVARRVLSEEDISGILAREHDERLHAAAELDTAGVAARAQELRDEAAVLEDYL